MRLLKVFKGLMGLVMGLMALTATARTPTRVEITTQPDGARIVVDGDVRGTAPLQLFDLTLDQNLTFDTKETLGFFICKWCKPG